LLDGLHRKSGQTLGELCQVSDMTRQPVIAMRGKRTDTSFVAMIYSGSRLDRLAVNLDKPHRLGSCRPCGRSFHDVPTGAGSRRHAMMANE